MKRNSRKGGVKRYQGFTLIEALVALLVLSFGLLGAAAMQLKTMQSAHFSYQRSIATLAAQDAVERLWVQMGEFPPACPEPSTVTADWHDAWSVSLPGMKTKSSLTRVGCEYNISIEWDDERFGSENTSLLYISQLPGETS